MFDIQNHIILTYYSILVSQPDYKRIEGSLRHFCFLLY